MEKYLTLKEMAEKLNRCERTFKKYVVLYNIPHIELGRDWLFNEKRVISYLESLPTQQAPKVKEKTPKKHKSHQGMNSRYAEMLGLR